MPKARDGQAGVQEEASHVTCRAVCRSLTQVESDVYSCAQLGSSFAVVCSKFELRSALAAAMLYNLGQI